MKIHQIIPEEPFFHDAAGRLFARMSEMRAFPAVLLMSCAFLGYLLVTLFYVFKHQMSIRKKIVVSVTIIGATTFCILGATAMPPMFACYLIAVMLLGAMQAQSNCESTQNVERVFMTRKATG